MLCTLSSRFVAQGYKININCYNNMLIKVSKASSYTKSWYVLDASNILVDYVG
jgi:hypothetical protein